MDSKWKGGLGVVAVVVGGVEVWPECDEDHRRCSWRRQLAVGDQLRRVAAPGDGCVQLGEIRPEENEGRRDAREELGRWAACTRWKRARSQRRRKGGGVIFGLPRSP